MIISRPVHVAAKDGCILLDGCVAYHCGCLPHLYPFVHQWTFGLFACLGCCEQYCCERRVHGSAIFYKHLKCSEYSLAGPAWTCSSSAACRRRIHGSCSGPICTNLANQSSVATQPLKAVPSLHFCSQPAYCPQASLGCFCLD